MQEHIIAAVREAGALIRSVRKVKAAEEKGSPRNLVTKYDRAVQALLTERLSLHFPDAAFLSEEEQTHTFRARGQLFIMDPIDGTANFVNGLGFSAISVALLEDGEPLFGAVYNPYTEELYTAKRGEGAYLNGERIWVANRPLREGLGLFGTSPYNEELFAMTEELFARMLRATADVRRMGSAALDLCMLAAGRADAFFEAVLRPWDYAAAGLILEEAGGRITDRSGAPLPYDRPSFVVAGSAVGYEEFFGLVQ